MDHPAVLFCLQVTTYKIHTVQHIGDQLPEEEDLDDEEALLRSFRIKTISDSPLPSGKQVESPPSHHMTVFIASSPAYL
jgi:hypothetical protein